MTKTGIDFKAKKRYLIFLLIFIIVFSLPIIDLDRNIHFSCIPMNEDNRIVLKCFVEPNEARFVTKGIDIRINSRFDFLPQKSYQSKVYKVDRVTSYYNGIAYRPVFGEVPVGTFDKENNILDGVVKVNKMSAFKLFYITVLNWFEPYSGEKIILQ